MSEIYDWWLEHHDKIVEYDVNKSRYKFKRTKEAKFAKDVVLSQRNLTKTFHQNEKRNEPWQKYAADTLMYVAGFTTGAAIGIRKGPLSGMRLGLHGGDQFVKVGNAFYNWLD